MDEVLIDFILGAAGEVLVLLFDGVIGPPSWKARHEARRKANEARRKARRKARWEKKNKKYL